MTPDALPRIILYHQTHSKDNEPVSLIPLLTSDISVTHINIAAIHLNATPGDITINDHHYTHAIHQPLYGEIPIMQQAGIKVMGMLGGAAKGTYERLDSDDCTSDPRFQAFYQPLREMVLLTGLDGLDLDVEEHMSLGGIIGLIDALKTDFGPEFLITLAPVAAAMEFRNNENWLKRTNLSGFDYFELEDVFGDQIAWYNAQFYCGWGDVTNSAQYERIVAKGWAPEKIVMGLTTNEKSAAGWVDDDVIRETLLALQARYGGDFAGVMGWEYWNSQTSSVPFGEHVCWARLMSGVLRPRGRRAARDIGREQNQKPIF